MTPRQSITIDRPQTATTKVRVYGAGYLVVKSVSPMKECAGFLFMGPQTANRRRRRWHPSKPSYFVGGDFQLSWLFHMIWLHFRLFSWGFLVGCTKFNWQLKYNIFICPEQTDENPCCHNNMNIICVWAFTPKRFDVMARKCMPGYRMIFGDYGRWWNICGFFIVRNSDWDFKFVLLWL